MGDCRFVPVPMQWRAVSVGSGVGGDDLAARIKNEGVFIRVAVAAAMWAVFQTEPGCVFALAVLENCITGGSEIARTTCSRGRSGLGRAGQAGAEQQCQSSAPLTVPQQRQIIGVLKTGIRQF